MQVDTAEARRTTDELNEVLAAARDQAATNASGTKYESVIDSLGSGFVTAVVDDADKLCEDDVLACVISNEPYRTRPPTPRAVAMPQMQERAAPRRGAVGLDIIYQTNRRSNRLSAKPPAGLRQLTVATKSAPPVPQPTILHVVGAPPYAVT